MGGQVVARQVGGDGAQPRGDRVHRREVAAGERDRAAQRESLAVLARAAVEQRLRVGELAALQAQADLRGQRGRLVVEAVEQARGLVAAALAEPQLGEHREGQHVAAAACAVRAAHQRLREHRVGALPVTRPHEHGAVDRAAPRLQRGVAAPLGEGDDRLAPLRGARQVGEAVADDERGAAGVAARERVARLAAERDGHRLVEQADALLDPPLPDDRAAELRERHALHVGVGERVRDGEPGARMALGVGRVGRPLRLLDRQPAQLGHRALPVEEAPRPREPAGGRGLLAVDPLLAGEVDGEPRGRERVPAAAVRGVGLAAALDPGLALAQPPQRLAEPVERLRIGVVPERGGERVARRGPVGAGEVPPAGLDALHGRGS